MSHAISAATSQVPNLLLNGSLTNLCVVAHVDLREEGVGRPSAVPVIVVSGALRPKDKKALE